MLTVSFNHGAVEGDNYQSRSQIGTVSLEGV